MPGLLDTQAAPDLPDERRLARVVATESYEDAALHRLRAPAHDAVDLGEVLADPEVGGFEVTSVIDGTAQEVRLAARIRRFGSGRLRPSPSGWTTTTLPVWSPQGGR